MAALLELMVVVALVGLMATVVVSSIGDGGREKQMENEARRLVAVVKLARDEAVLMSEELSLVIEDNNHYSFQRLGEKQWEPLADDHILNQHTLQSGLMLELQLESYAFTPKRKKSTDSNTDRSDDKAVRIYFLSSGEVQPFSLYIKVKDDPDSIRFKVMADEEGKVSWQGPLHEGDT